MHLCMNVYIYGLSLVCCFADNITFISPRIYKGSYKANFSEKEKTKKKNINNKNKNKIIYYIQYLKLLFT